MVTVRIICVWIRVRGIRVSVSDYVWVIKDIKLVLGLWGI